MNEAEANGNHLDFIKFRNYSMRIQKKHIVLLMQFLKFQKTEYMVAPYEADAQLAYMHKIGQIDYVITEDSDLVLYGCGSIINKLNQSGYCELLQIRNNKLMWTNSDTEEVEEFISLEYQQKIWMSLMVGCDYIQKVRGVGLKKGIEMVQECKNISDVFKIIEERCPRFDLSANYKKKFQLCELIFKYQVVYNPISDEFTYFESADTKMKERMRTSKVLKEFIGELYEGVKRHVTGQGIMDMVEEKDRLTYDFAGIEEKLNFSNYTYSMNPISNLVMGDSNTVSEVKDDLQVYLNKSKKFYNVEPSNSDEQEQNKKEQIEEGFSEDSDTENVKKTDNNKKRPRSIRRARSTDLLSNTPKANNDTTDIKVTDINNCKAEVKSRRSTRQSKRNFSTKNLAIESEIIQDLIKKSFPIKTVNPKSKVGLSQNSTNVPSTRTSRFKEKQTEMVVNTVNTRSKAAFGHPRPVRKSSKRVSTYQRRDAASKQNPIPILELLTARQCIKSREVVNETVNICSKMPYRVCPLEVLTINSTNKQPTRTWKKMGNLDDLCKSKEIYNKESVLKKKVKRGRNKLQKFSQNIREQPKYSLYNSPTEIGRKRKSLSSDEEGFSEGEEFRVEETGIKGRSIKSRKRIKIE